MLANICLEESDVSRWVPPSKFGGHNSSIASDYFNAIAGSFVCGNHMSRAPNDTARRRAIFILQGHHACGRIFHNLPNAVRPFLNPIHRLFLIE